MMEVRRLWLLVVVLALAATGSGAAVAQGPEPVGGEPGQAVAAVGGGCVAGGVYDPACDVDHDGDVDVLDVQLTATHWGQSGVWSSGSWDLTGNSGTTPGVNFLGTTDGVSLTLAVSGTVALRLGPTTGTPNLLGGYSGNSVTGGAAGATIAGGGTSSFPNRVTDDFGTVGGGEGNRAGDDAGTPHDEGYATVGGGYLNSAGAYAATVGGGAGNIAGDARATVGGGSSNAASGAAATISGGRSNQAGGDHSTVAGGYGNLAGGNSSFVGGGGYDGVVSGNQARALASTIGGGMGNVITDTANYAFIGGGSNNAANGLMAVVGGGTNNSANGDVSTVAGGHGNVATIYGSFVGGGGYDGFYFGGNQARGLASTVGGGLSNVITGTGHYAFIGGGSNNSVSGDYATVGGGRGNSASNRFTTVGGGLNNSADGLYTTVSGGETNSAGAGYASVAGGFGNTASGAGSFVGGGGYDGSIYWGNVAAGSAATIGGGLWNRIAADGSYGTIGGGYSNSAGGYAATVAGGSGNSAGGDYATAAGGRENVAAGNYSFAAGRRARANHAGTFVWADSTNSYFDSTATNQFLIRAGGGVGLGITAPAAQLHVSSSGGDAMPQVRVSQTSGDYVRVRLTNDSVSVADGYSNRWDIGAIATTFTIYSGKYSQNALTLTPGDATNYLSMGNGARLTAGGAWTNASDRGLKANWAGVEPAAVLAQVAQLPISTWNYRAEGRGVRHMGPTAQDFYAAFGLGDSDTAIATVDADGVALAAIQGLYQVLREKEAHVAALKSQVGQQQGEIDALRREKDGQIVALEARLAALEQAVAVSNSGALAPVAAAGPAAARIPTPSAAWLVLGGLLLAGAWRRRP